MTRYDETPTADRTDEAIKLPQFRIEAEAGDRIHGTYYPNLDAAKEAVERTYPRGEWIEVPPPGDEGEYNSHEYCISVEDCPARIDVVVR